VRFGAYCLVATEDVLLCLVCGWSDVTGVVDATSFLICSRDADDQLRGSEVLNGSCVSAKTEGRQRSAAGVEITSRWLSPASTTSSWSTTQ